MIRRIFIFGWIGLFALSCDKLEKMEDDIINGVFNPYLKLNPVDSIAPILSCDESIPYPTDSTASVYLDINNDEVDDFKITYTINYEFVSTVDSCLNYNSSVVMTALGIGNKILINDKNLKDVALFEAGQKIPGSISTLESTSATLFQDAQPNQINYELSTKNRFIGVRLNAGGYGWIKFYHEKEAFLLTIMNHAYNRNIHLPINAGQSD